MFNLIKNKENMKKFILCLYNESENQNISYEVFDSLETAKTRLKELFAAHSNDRTFGYINGSGDYFSISENEQKTICSIEVVETESSFAVGSYIDETFSIDDFLKTEDDAVDTMDDLANSNFTPESMDEMEKLGQFGVIKGHFGDSEDMSAYFVIKL